MTENAAKQVRHGIVHGSSQCEQRQHDAVGERSYKTRPIGLSMSIRIWPINTDVPELEHGTDFRDNVLSFKIRSEL